MSKLIVIIGITGTQGASVADAFLADSSWKVRGITRNPAKRSSLSWKNKGVELVAGDLDDPASIQEAFRGATAIFGVTDGFQYFSSPEHQRIAQKTGKTLNEVMHERELKQGKNIIDAAAAELRRGNGSLERFVLSTLSWCKKWSKGKYTWNHHFDAKWEMVEYLRGEERLRELKKKTSLVQLGYFATNWTFTPGMAPKRQPDGTYLIRTCLHGDIRVGMIVTRDDTGAYVHALVTALPPGQNMLAFSWQTSWAEYAEVWGKVMGKECRHEYMDPSELETHMGALIGRELGDMFRYTEEFGYDGGDPSVVTAKQLGLDLKLTSLEDYIRKEDWSSVL